ncbi:C40 family peptidase [Lacrimispora sp. JR3]|uniref:C40 family peptidase n=1 Tax=Lacrimispora sinapis TaxID=3111456 RepID=UPI00374A657C
MMKKTWKTLGLMAFCSAIVLAGPSDVKADEISGPGLSYGSYLVTVHSDKVTISKDEDGNEALMTASKGSSFEVLEDMGDGFVKVKVNDTYGYLPVKGNATVTETDEETLAALKDQKKVEETVDFRQSIANFGLQFVGGRYAYGGTDPHTGVDCSGFTRYIMKHAAGITISRSSGGQAAQGRAISADQMRPGDLIFYGNGRSINHVAMYIGNGQVVHSSTYRTGIKTSPWNYRTPVKIVNILGD